MSGRPVKGLGVLNIASKTTVDPTVDQHLPGLQMHRVHQGDDPRGMGFEVLEVELLSTGDPTLSQMRQTHAFRLRKRVFPLVVAAFHRGRGLCWLFGPNPDTKIFGPLPAADAARMLQAALDEPTGLAAWQRLSAAQRAYETLPLPGVSNQGLFASHYVASDDGVKASAGWERARSESISKLTLRGQSLISALGYTSSRSGAYAHLLTAGAGRPRAVAVLLEEGEMFDAQSSRFAVSPVAYGLALAQREEVPWLLIMRGSQLRLYPSSPDVGVGRRGLSETYFEVDLALLSEENAGFLGLVFTADALAPQGSISGLLAESERFATALGARLRQRVYEHVVPDLAVAVAEELRSSVPEHAGDLDLSYRLTLRILFRLLFQAYAEDRGLLPYPRNERYRRNALKTWAIDLASDPEMDFDRASQSIWDDLSQVWRVIDSGDTAWDVPAYDGGLFGANPDHYPEGAILARIRLTNDVIGKVLRHLLIDTTADGTLGAVDFRSLSVREFGTIYEGLLESSLSVADVDLTIDAKDVYLPADPGDEVKVRAGQIYFHNRSGERKATGSYFTPSFAVEHLLERALDPTISEHLERVKGRLDAGDDAGAAEDFFDFRVGDLAMGSGHFLVAAIDHIESAMAGFLAEHPVPGVVDELRRLEAAARDALGDAHTDYEIEPSGLLRRQIARRCIYGIDLNPIAVELARVAVWIHTFVPGLPMSSLDHNLVCANTLTGIGTIDEALASLEPDRKHGMPSILLTEIEESLARARRLLVDVANSSEATKAEVQQAVEIHEQARREAEPTRLLFDAAVAIRIGAIQGLVALAIDDVVELARTARVQEAMTALQPAHMPYLFPEVFLRDRSGFDVLLGNPPWEKVKVEEHGWWGLRFPGLRGLSQAKKNALIKGLRASRPDLLQAYEAEVAVAQGMRSVVNNGPYPGIGSGDIDLYQAFAWRNWQLMSDSGRAGVVLPRGALSGSGTVEWRRAILEGGRFDDVCFLTNNSEWVFAGIHMSYTIGLTTIHKDQPGAVTFCGPFYNAGDYRRGRDNRASIPVDEFTGWSETAAFPTIPDAHAAEIIRKMRRHPELASGQGPFSFRPHTDLHTTADKALYDFDLEEDRGRTRVVTGRTFHLWDPDFGKPYAYGVQQELCRRVLEKARRSTRLTSSPLHGRSIATTSDLPMMQPRIVFRDVARSTDSRTVICCLMPPGEPVVDKAPYLLRVRGVPTDEAYLLGSLASIPFDWYARRWVEVKLSYQLLNSMPVPRPDDDEPLRLRLVELSGRLAAPDNRFAEWAAAVGVPVGTLLQEPERSDAIAEIDALVSLLYGLDWDDVVHIFETFHRGWDYRGRLAAVKVHYDRWQGQA